MISTRQLKILQSLLVRRFNDREARLAFLSSLVCRELGSSKELTEDEAFKVLDWLGYNYSNEAYFDSHSTQHLSILAKCHELGWVQVDSPRIPDLQRLGKWLLSKKCPVQKPLKEMTTKEVSKVIGALEKIIEKQYEKSNKRQVTSDKCPHKHQVLRTIGGHCTVEITAVFCADCGKKLTKTKVET